MAWRIASTPSFDIEVDRIEGLDFMSSFHPKRLLL